MSSFTFETAWIVAHLQNDANERLKEDIRDRLTERRYFADLDGFRHHEVACSYYECCRKYGFPFDQTDYDWFTSDWSGREQRTDFQRWDDLVTSRFNMIPARVRAQTAF